MRRRRSSGVPRAVCAVVIASLTVGSIQPWEWAPRRRPAAVCPPGKASCKADPGITDTEIKLGSLVSTSGAGAQVAAELDGIKARILKANEEGELGDRQITLVNEDDAADPAKNLSAAQKLVEEEGSFAIIAGSVAGDASGQYLNQEGVPVVGWQTGLPVFGTYKNYFGMQNSQTKDRETNFTTLQADALKALGAKKIALIGYSTANAAAFIRDLGEAVEKTKGLELVYNTSDVAPGTNEFGSYAQQIKDSGADALYTGMDLVPNTQLVQRAAVGRRRHPGAGLPRWVRQPGPRDPGHRRRVLRPGVEAVRADEGRRCSRATWTSPSG